MEFQIKYYKKGNSDIIFEVKEFKNENALKRWYKKEFFSGNMEFPFFSGWNITEDKKINYMIKSWFKQ